MENSEQNNLNCSKLEIPETPAIACYALKGFSGVI